MENTLPYIESFCPWEMNTREVEVLVGKLMQDLKSMCRSKKEFNVDVAIALNGALNQKRMALWSREIERAEYANRKVRITYDDEQGFFKIFAEDGSAVLSGYPANVIRENNWVAASDAQDDLTAVVYAPKDKQDFLERLFAEPRSILING